MSHSPLKILITGGSGFIGTHLCRKLRALGHSVHVLDLVAPKSLVAGVEYKTGDVLDKNDLRAAVDGVAAVFHLAATVSVSACQEEPIHSYQNNLVSTALVADAVAEESRRQNKNIKIIFSSSAAVYADVGTASKLLSESNVSLNPLSFYAAQKLGSEQVLRLYHNTYALSAVVLRFFNVYGLGQDPHSPYSGVMSIFSKNIKQGQPLVLHGGGDQTRDFVSVHDVVRACVLALDLAPAYCDAEPINIGTGVSVTVKQLADEMLKASKKQVPIHSAAVRQGDVKYSTANVSRALEVLKWSPQVTLYEGLKELI